MHAKHVLYVGTLLRTIQAGIENTSPLINNLSRLLRKNLCSSMWVSTAEQNKEESRERNRICKQTHIQGNVMSALN